MAYISLVPLPGSLTDGGMYRINNADLKSGRSWRSRDGDLYTPVHAAVSVGLIPHRSTLDSMIGLCRRHEQILSDIPKDSWSCSVLTRCGIHQFYIILGSVVATIRRMKLRGHTCMCFPYMLHMLIHRYGS